MCGLCLISLTCPAYGWKGVLFVHYLPEYVILVLLEDHIVDLGVYWQSRSSDPLHQGDFELPGFDQVREELRALPQLIERDLLLEALMAYLFLVDVVQEVNDQDFYAMNR